MPFRGPTGVDLLVVTVGFVVDVTVVVAGAAVVGAAVVVDVLAHVEMLDKQNEITQK
jgi:hypothetical protein